MKLVVRREPVYRRRRALALLALVVALTLLVLLGAKACGGPAEPTAAGTPASPTSSTPTSTTPAVATHLVQEGTITGDITPRSLAASSKGLVAAANMMYRHTVTVYDATGRLTSTIADAVDLGRFGVAGKGRTQGAPVETVFTPDGSKAYVSNYSMSGAGFGPEPPDSCATDPKAAGSYLYRIDAATLAVDQVVAVGAVPKDLAVTPDAKTVVVANWCSGDLSVVDTATAAQRARVAIGEHPRGVAVSRDGRTAYVLSGPVSGAPGSLHAVDLAAGTARRLAAVGPDPRRIAVSPDGSLLVTGSGDDTVRRLDAGSGAELRRVAVPGRPRSIALSTDGASAYVVSYGAARLTALRTSDLSVRSTVATPARPTGVAVEPTRGRVWVAGYTGTIARYAEVPDAMSTGTPAGTTSPALPSGTTTAPPATAPLSRPPAVGSASVGPATPTT